MSLSKRDRCNEKGSFGRKSAQNSQERIDLAGVCLWGRRAAWLVIIGSGFNQLFIGSLQRSARQVAAPAGEVQPHLRQSGAIFSELPNLPWIDGHLVGAQIAHEALRFAPSDLDQARHVTVQTGQVRLAVPGNFLVGCGFQMALAAFHARRWQLRPAQLDNAGVGVMAGDAIQNSMFASPKVTVRLGVVDEAVLNGFFWNAILFVATFALLPIAPDAHIYGRWIGGMQAARSVTLFAADALLSPDAGGAGQFTGRDWVITSRMAGGAV